MVRMFVFTGLLAIVVFFQYSSSNCAAAAAPAAKLAELPADGRVTVIAEQVEEGDLFSREIQKRSIRSKSPSSRKNYYYRLQFQGNESHLIYLNLTQNQRLMSPAFVIEKWKKKNASIDSRISTKKNQSNCYFFGKIIDDEHSNVAVSTCNGLAGVLHSAGQDYLIEKSQDKKESGVHILYKRSSAIRRAPGFGDQSHEDAQQWCGTKSTEYTTRENELSSSAQRSRKKRSIKSVKNVETLVVVDRSMMEYYHDHLQDVETYVLTVMNLVSRLYHDASIGNPINVVLVKLILLEEDEPELKVEIDATKTLQSFCSWQSKVNPKGDSNPHHHDVAVLLTRKDICRGMDEPCGTLGLAPVNGMCQTQKSCSVNEDNGLSLGFTVAHELGHNFGIYHDGEGNRCKPSNGKRPFIMSPLLQSKNTPMMWSTCSESYISRFLERGWGNCLDDEPGEHTFQYNNIPPGIMYDVDHQCRLQFGDNATRCSWMPNVCSTLWCAVGKRCVSKLGPAAQGTMCGKEKWCYADECVAMEEQAEKIDGGWSQWSNFTGCSRTCGAGVRIAERSCENPAPANGGAYCEGQWKKYEICNIEPCPENTPSFRKVQCQAFDNTKVNGRYHNWVPDFRKDRPCELHCRPEKGFFMGKQFSEKVQDGTPCQYGSRDMCINGICKYVGCDFIINSDAREDGCGVCRGDGTSCKTVKSEFNLTNGLGYVEAGVIPPGARNIHIEEVAEANNYLALRGDSGKYFINGHWYIKYPGEYEAAGTIVTYERLGSKEKLTALGPLKETLHVMLLFQDLNPGVVVEYTIRKDNESADRTPEFEWVYLEWSHCSASCGKSGLQTREVRCVEKLSGIVDNSYCNRTARLEVDKRRCNEQECPPNWWTGPWQHCSTTCGLGVRKRSVLCIKSLSYDEKVALPEKECLKNEKKPLGTEFCNQFKGCRQRTSKEDKSKKTHKPTNNPGVVGGEDDKDTNNLYHHHQEHIPDLDYDQEVELSKDTAHNITFGNYEKLLERGGNIHDLLGNKRPPQQKEKEKSSHKPTMTTTSEFTSDKGVTEERTTSSSYSSTVIIYSTAEQKNEDINNIERNRF